MFRGRQVVIRSLAVAKAVNRRLSTHCPAAYLAQEEVAQRVITIVSPFLPTTAGPADHFVAKLGLDRVAVSRIIQELSNEFCVNVSFVDANRINSVDTATDYFSHHPKAR
jgi:acyl carrier protein